MERDAMQYGASTWLVQGAYKNAETLRTFNILWGIFPKAEVIIHSKLQQRKPEDKNLPLLANLLQSKRLSRSMTSIRASNQQALLAVGEHNILQLFCNYSCGLNFML
jgi:hypothetical protein